MKKSWLVILFIFLTTLLFGAKITNQSFLISEHEIISDGYNIYKARTLIGDSTLNNNEKNYAKAILQLCYYNKKHFDYNVDSLRLYSKNIGWDSDIKKDIEYTIFESYYNLKQYKKAQQIGEQLAKHIDKHDQTKINLDYKLGVVYNDLNQPEKAVKSIWNSIQNDTTQKFTNYTIAYKYEKILKIYKQYNKDTTEHIYFFCDSAYKQNQIQIKPQREVNAPLSLFFNRFIFLDTLYYLSRQPQFSIPSRINLAKEALKQINIKTYQKQQLCDIYNNIGNLYLLSDNQDSAYHYFQYAKMFSSNYESYYLLDKKIECYHNSINCAIQSKNKIWYLLGLWNLYDVDTLLQSQKGINDNNVAEYIYRIEYGDLKSGYNNLGYHTIINHILLKTRFLTIFSLQTPDMIELYNSIIQDIADTLSTTVDKLLSLKQKEFYHNTNALVTYKMEEYDSLTNIMKQELELKKRFYYSQLSQTYNTKNFGKRAYSSSERKTEIKKQNKVFGDNIYIYSYLTDYQPIIKVAFDYTIFGKDLQLSTDAQLYSAKTNKAKELLYIRKLFKKQLYNEPNLLRKDTLQNIINNIERDLSIINQDTTNLKQIKDFTQKDISRALKNDEAVVEFIQFPKYIDWCLEDDTLYCAMVLLPNDSTIKFVYLAPTLEIARYIKTNPLDINRILNSTELYNTIWKPIEQYLNGIKTIYFSPSGLLNNIPIEYAKINEQETISEKFNFIRLTSTKNIITYHPYLNINSNQATLYGDIAYGLTDSTMMSNANYYSNLRSDRGQAGKLEYSKQEIQQISNILKSNGIKVNTFTQKKAVEESFKYIEHNNPDIIHISTHGFYWTNEQAQNNKLFINRINPIIEIDPMERCGLLLAGANNALRGIYNDSIEDGILTADEIAQTDLHNTQLVVLPACNTGLGDYDNEGVWGLQRAFKLAGVKQMVMSLWQVDDEATTLLMKFFYEELFATHNAVTALKKAQNKMRNIPKYSAPYYWAGFIVIN